MNNAIHLMNRTHTHVDVEKDSFISLPKDGTDKPPVNADINNLIIYGNTTGGEGTPLVEKQYQFNLTSCGRNLINFENAVYEKNATYTLNSVSVSVTSASTSSNSYIAIPVTLPLGKNYTLAVKLKVLSGTSNSVSGIQLRETSTGGGYYGSTTFTHNSEWQTVLINITTQNRLPLIYLWLYNKVAIETSDNFVVEYSDIRIYEGTYTLATVPAYEAYTGDTLPYRFEATNVIEVANFAALPATGEYRKQYKTLDDGKLWEWAGQAYTEFKLRSLPDGEKDEYDHDTGALGKKGKKLVVASGTGWLFNETDNSTYVQLRYYDNSQTYSNDLGITYNGFCNIAVAQPGKVPGNFVMIRNASFLAIYLCVPYAEVISLDNAGAVAWINAQITAMESNIEFVYELATPITYQIKPYSAEFPYNQKPKSIQYHCNIFTDANIEMQCEVRKLGNRKMSEYQLYTSEGLELETLQLLSDCNNVLGTIFTTVSNKSETEFTVSPKYHATLDMTLPAGTYTLNRAYSVLSGTPVSGETGNCYVYKLLPDLEIEEIALITGNADTDENDSFILEEETDITIYFNATETEDANLNVRFYNVALTDGTLIPLEIRI